jgi:hypothetical protein
MEYKDPFHQVAERFAATENVLGAYPVPSQTLGEEAGVVVVLSLLNEGLLHFEVWRCDVDVK